MILKINAIFTRDTIPPVLESVRFSTRNSLEFRFNEDVSSGSQSIHIVGNDIDS